MIDNQLSDADQLGQIADEFVEAYRQGKCPSVEQFARRYPERAAEIREMLPTLVLMEQAKSTDDSSGYRRRAQAATAAAPLQQLGDWRAPPPMEHKVDFRKCQEASRGSWDDRQRAF